MAFTKQEKKIILYMKDRGYSREETISELEDYRASQGQSLTENQPIIEQQVSTEKPEYLQQKDIKKPKEDKSFVRELGGVAKSSAQFLGDSAKYVSDGINNFLGGAISQVPKVVGNTAATALSLGKAAVSSSTKGLIIGRIAPEQKEKIDNALGKLQNQFIEDGIETKEGLQEFFNTAPDSKLAKFGGYATELGAIISPTPAGKSNLVLKGRKLLEGIKGGKIINGIVEGAVIGAKTEAITEGEITSEGLEEGAFLGGAFGILGATANKIVPKKTRENLEKKIIENISPLLKVGKNKKLSKEQNTAVQAVNVLKTRNPSFKIKDTDNALKETYDEIVKTKTSIFKEYDEILKKNNVEIKGFNLKKEVDGIFEDEKFKTLLRNSFKTDSDKNAAFDILIKKINNASSNRTLGELYEDTKFLNNQLSGLFNKTSSKDALESLINLEVLKKYNGVISKTIGALDDKTFKGLKGEYSALRTFEDQVSNNLKKVQTKMKSQLHTYADAYLDSSLVTSILSGNVTGAAQSALTRTLRDKFSRDASPNILIKNVFKSYDDIQDLVNNPTKASLLEKFETLGISLSGKETIDDNK